MILKKTLTCGLISLVVFLVCLIVANSYITVESEEGFYRCYTWLKFNSFPASRPPEQDSILMINTQNDVQTFRHIQGNDVTVNRSELIRLFSYLVKSEDSTYSVLLDVNMRNDQNFWPGQKDSLQTLINKLSFICMPAPLSKPRPPHPFAHVHYGNVDYKSNGEQFDKLKLSANEPGGQSLPLVMYNRLHSSADLVQFGWLIHHGQLCFNYIWPVNFCKYEAVRDAKSADSKSLVEVVSLEKLLERLDGDSSLVKTAFRGRQIFIADLSNIEASHDKKMPDVFILANAYLTLVKGAQIVNFFWLLITYGLFAILSYYAYYKNLPRLKIRGCFVLEFLFNKYIEEVMSYGFILLLWSVLSILVLNISVNVIPGAILFSLLNYFKFKKYKKHV